MNTERKIRKGDKVRDLKWDDKFTGTVVRTKTVNGERRVFVQWDNSAVEDELLESKVQLLSAEKPNATKESILGIAKHNMRNHHYIYEAKVVLDEWFGDAIKDGNCTAAEAFAVAINLMEERLNPGK